MITEPSSGAGPARPGVTMKLTGPDAAATRISITGDIDRCTAYQVQQAVIQALRQQRPTRIEVDLGGVGFLDSAGIRALVLSRADAEQVDCRLTLVNARPLVRQVLAIAGLLDRFGMLPAAGGGAPAVGAHWHRVDLGRC
jgi:anti-anti-sigma factor